MTGPKPAEARDLERAAEFCREVAELPDRTSPDEYPDMLLVTADELEALLLLDYTAVRAEAINDAILELQEMVSDLEEKLQIANIKRAEAFSEGVEASIKMLRDRAKAYANEIMASKSLIRWSDAADYLAANKPKDRT